jgi:hypothetical protein
MLALALVLAAPPPVLQVVRERLKSGAEGAYSEVERDVARTCAQLGAPHPYLALESWQGAKEVWWLNFYGSDAEAQQVRQRYAGNAALAKALAGAAARKKELVEGTTDAMGRFRPALTDSSWRFPGARLFVAVERKELKKRVPGVVFALARGAFLVLVPAASRLEAQQAARELGHDARIFAIRPDWSVPAPEWVAADPEFWGAQR